jgi:hypothetical protein
VRLVLSPQKPGGVPDANWIQTNPEKGLLWGNIVEGK